MTKRAFVLLVSMPPLVGCLGLGLAGDLEDHLADDGFGDAGLSDAGLRDAGLSDAGLHNAGPSDAGLRDAGPSDAGLHDAGLSDAGLHDGGLHDAGLLDAGPTDGGPDEFDFIVFGDLNGGGCLRNGYVAQNVQAMANEPGVAFFVQTGDLIDGYVSSGETLCFARDPTTVGLAACASPNPQGNAAALLSPLKDRPPRPGLALSLYPVIGNHDDGWGDAWYPDPCGEGICAFLAPHLPAEFINHPYPGDMCSTTSRAQSAFAQWFFYSFTYRNSYFIVLKLNNDYDNMISACNSHPGFPDCASYCSAETLAGDAARNASCWGGAEQFDFLRDELRRAQAYEHIFVFGHAPLLGSGENHGPTANAEVFRALFDASNVDFYFNGHNHGYERTHPVRAAMVDPTGTTYVTVGSGGALLDGLSRDWFTAASYQDWASWGDQRANTLYVKVHVSGARVTGQVKSLSGGTTPVDTF